MAQIKNVTEVVDIPHSRIPISWKIGYVIF